MLEDLEMIKEIIARMNLAKPIHAKKNQIYVSDFIKYNMVFLNFRYSLKLNAIKDFEFNDFDKCSMTISNVVVLFDSSIVYSIKKNPKYLQFKTLESLNKIFNEIRV